MKRNTIFDQCLANVSPETREEVRLNMDIADRIYELLQEKKLTQREFARLMDKRESEISRWLTGSHGFTTSTLAKISAVLGEPIVVIKQKPVIKYVYLNASFEYSASSAPIIARYSSNNNYQRNYSSLNRIHRNGKREC